MALATHGRELEQLLAELERQVRAALERGGFRVRAGKDAGEEAFVLHAQKGAAAYLLVGRAATESRRLDLQGYLADALLRAGARAGKGTTPVGLVGARAVSEPLAAQLGAYMEAFAPAAAYGIADLRGRLELHGPGLEEIEGRPPAAAAPGVSASTHDVLSDLGQWMLKVLLGGRLPGELVATGDARIGSAVELARVAEVSVAVAARQVAALREQQQLIDSGGRLALVNRERLLRRWRAANARPVRDVAARWLLPGSRRLGDVLRSYVAKRLERAAAGAEVQWSRARWREGPRACLGLFAACSALGVGRVQGVPPHLYLEEVSPQLLEELGLRPATPGEGADVLVRRPRFREAVFRGAVVRDGVPAADVLQCWLDVADHPGRGAEQAEFLWRKVLGRALRDSP